MRSYLRLTAGLAHAGTVVDDLCAAWSAPLHPVPHATWTDEGGDFILHLGDLFVNVREEKGRGLKRRNRAGGRVG
jgi:hypothetical protein